MLIKGWVLFKTIQNKIYPRSLRTVLSMMEVKMKYVYDTFYYILINNSKNRILKFYKVIPRSDIFYGHKRLGLFQKDTE